MGKKWHKQQLDVPFDEFMLGLYLKGTGWDVRKADPNNPDFDYYTANKRITIAAYLIDPASKDMNMDGRLRVCLRYAEAMYGDMTMEQRVAASVVYAARCAEAKRKHEEEIARRKSKSTQHAPRAAHVEGRQCRTGTKQTFITPPLGHRISSVIVNLKPL